MKLEKDMHSTIFKVNSLETVFDGIRLSSSNNSNKNKLINIHSSVALLSIMYGNHHVYEGERKKR